MDSSGLLIVSGSYSERQGSDVRISAPARAPAALLVALIRLYQRGVSPLHPGSCKYHPSCSEYAAGAIRRYGAVRGAILAGWRLLRCNPWSHGGVDYA